VRPATEPMRGERRERAVACAQRLSPCALPKVQYKSMRAQSTTYFSSYRGHFSASPATKERSLKLASTATDS
jgi:hypothetical protein